jgi:hypothetical protein
MKTLCITVWLVAASAISSATAESPKSQNLEETLAGMASSQVVYLHHRDSGTLRGHITAFDLEQKRLQFRRLYQDDRVGQTYPFAELESLSWERSSGLSTKWTAIGAGIGFALGGAVVLSLSTNGESDGSSGSGHEDVIGAAVWLGTTVVGAVAGLVLPPILSKETVHCRFEGPHNNE